MKSRAYLLHALSPLHAGTGHSADIIDLPIARMKGTNIPFVPGSSIKGVLRDARRPISKAAFERQPPDQRQFRSEEERKSDEDDWLATFGPETPEASLHGGALIVGDARLLALPVRSFRGTFVWVTSPLLLRLADRDLCAPGTRAVPTVAARSAKVTEQTVSNCGHANKLYLEDLDLEMRHDAVIDIWAALFAPAIGADIFSNRFAFVDDDTMTFLAETATQIDQRIRIDPVKRTAVNGALWLEESLPPETLLIGLLGADRGRKPGHDLIDAQVLDIALPPNREQVLQLGGKATVGRGRCRMVPLA